MTTVKTGSALPASAHRQADQKYVTDRNLENLSKLGISADTLNVARRGDRITDPTGSVRGEPVKMDGMLTLNELDRLDEPGNAAVLFPAERAAVDKVDALFQLPPGTEVAVNPAKPIEYSLERTLVTPAKTRINIADAPAALRDTASRIQLAKNSDGNAATLDASDVEWARQPANRGRFTPESLAKLADLAKLFHGDVHKEVVTARLADPKQTQALAQFGGASVSVETNTDLILAGRSGRSSVAVQRVTQRLLVSAPPDAKVFIKSTGTVTSRAQFFEHVLGKGERASLEVPGLGAAPQSLWIQVVKDDGTVLENKRLILNAVKHDVTLPAECKGKPVSRWVDQRGSVIQPRDPAVLRHYKMDPTRAADFESGKVFAPK